MNISDAIGLTAFVGLVILCFVAPMASDIKELLRG